jgi:hypothetical protein
MGAPVDDLVRVITTCTSRKAQMPGSSTTASLPGLEPVAAMPIAAERLYVGEQHRRLMAGVDELRARRVVAVWILSAKAGLVPGEDRLDSYDETFAGLRPHELRRRADELGIADAFRHVAGTPCSLTLVLAGNEYFDAAKLAEPVDWGGPAIAFVSTSRALEVQAHCRLRVIAVGQDDAKRFSLPLTLLKGELARRLLSGLAIGSDDLPIAERANALLDSIVGGGVELVTAR